MAVKAFFSGGVGGGQIQPCAPTANQFAPTPVTPTQLAYVHPPATLGGRPGRTLVAVLDTLVDLNRQVIAATLQADAELPSGSSFGGLRGGYARLASSVATLHDFSFVPGVQLTATFPVKNRELQTANDPRLRERTPPRHRALRLGTRSRSAACSAADAST